jgi:mannose/fructose-specific phosphotransferase system component IIA
MSEELQGVVVCHGPLAEALVHAAEQISGLNGALIPVSNSGCDRDTLEQRILAAVNGRPAVVFVDLASVDFVFHRALPPAEAASRAAAAGEKSIRIP